MNTPTLLRTDSTFPEFQALVKLLDRELAVRDGDDHAFYAQFNKTDKLKNVIVAFQDEQPVACGAFRRIDDDSVEIKRMYVLETHRGRGIAGKVLQELEQWAGALHYSRCVLETGKNQPEAIRLYEKSSYSRIPNYGQYAGIDNSVCMEKWLDGNVHGLLSEGFSISTGPTQLDIPAIHRYLSEESYWSKGIPFETLEKSVRNSLCFGVYHQNEQVGFARIISDYATIAYLGDVFILPQYRGKGLSIWLMKRISTHPELQGLRRWLLGTKDAHELYRRFGWKPLAIPERWMELHNPEVYRQA